MPIEVIRPLFWMLESVFVYNFSIAFNNQSIFKKTGQS